MLKLSELTAIDIHTHAEEPCGTHADDGYDDFQAGMHAYFKSPFEHPPTIPETAAYFRERKIGAVIFPVDAERETGFRRYNNEEMAELAAQHSDILIPFASIDPAKGKMGAREARRLVKDFGIRGFKFHPTMQGFYPNDRSAYVLYEAIAECGVPALFHTGQTGVGAGMRGGMGMKLKYSNPDLHRRRGGGFSRHADHPRAPVVSLAGGGAVGRDPQAERLYRPVGLVAALLPEDPGAVRELDPAAQSAVRLGLAGHHAGPLACRLREDRDQA